MNDTPTQTIADALLLLSLGERNEIGKDASERLMKLERENAALLLKIQDLELQNNAMRSTSRGKEVAKNKKLERENAALRADKERLDSGRIRLKFHVRCDVWKVVDCDNVDLRDAIDAARKEAQP
jgi:hypothetical protein